MSKIFLNNPKSPAYAVHKLRLHHKWLIAVYWIYALHAFEYNLLDVEIFHPPELPLAHVNYVHNEIKLSAFYALHDSMAHYELANKRSNDKEAKCF